MSGIIEEIEMSIDNGRIDTIEKLAREFTGIENKFCDNFPNVPQKKEIWLG